MSDEPRTARLARNLTLGHRANAGEDTVQVDFSKGDDVVIISKWADHTLVKDGIGRLFTLPNDALEP